MSLFMYWKMYILQIWKSEVGMKKLYTMFLLPEKTKSYSFIIPGAPGRVWDLGKPVISVSHNFTEVYIRVSGCTYCTFAIVERQEEKKETSITKQNNIFNVVRGFLILIIKMMNTTNLKETESHDVSL